MKEILKTNRLRLTEFNREDVDGFFLMNEDPIVLQFTGDRPFLSKEACANFIENYQRRYRSFGYGRWTVRDLQTNEYLGWCGLSFSSEKKETDIGFRFLQKHWGKGYATESAIACLDYGFHMLQLDRIVGRAMKDNAASHRVLEKLGMQFQKEYQEEGKGWVQYELFKPSNI